MCGVEEGWVRCVVWRREVCECCLTLYLSDLDLPCHCPVVRPGLDHFKEGWL